MSDQHLPPDSGRIAAALLAPAISSWLDVPVLNVNPGSLFPENSVRQVYVRAAVRQDRYTPGGLRGEVWLGLRGIPWPWTTADEFKDGSGLVSASGAVRAEHMDHAEDAVIFVKQRRHNRVSGLVVVCLRVEVTLSTLIRQQRPPATNYLDRYDIERAAA